MTQHWDIKIDEIIVNKLWNDDKAYFLQLLSEIKGKEGSITKAKLSRHLNKLEKQNILVKDKFRPGLKRHYYLTSTARILIALDLGIGFNIKNKKEYEKRNMKALWLLFGIAIEGYGYYKEPSHDDLWTHIIMKNGVSVEDAMRGKNSDISRKFLDNFSRDEIRKTIEKLKELEIFIPVSEDDNGETRYDFSPKYKRLSEFIQVCNKTLDALVWRMEYYWIHINRKINKEQMDWFVSIIGKQRVKNFFLDVSDEKQKSIEINKEANKEWFEKANKDYSPRVQEVLSRQSRRLDRESIEKYDKYIKNKTEQIEQNFKDVKKRHRVFYDIGLNFINPPFLRELSTKLT